MTVNEQTAFGFSGTMACVEIMGGLGDVPSYSEPEAHRETGPTASARGSAKHGADGRRCYGLPRSYLTGWKTA